MKKWIQWYICFCMEQIIEEILNRNLEIKDIFPQWLRKSNDIIVIELIWATLTSKNNIFLYYIKPFILMISSWEYFYLFIRMLHFVYNEI